MAAKAVALAEARTPAFQTYAQAIADNAKTLADGLLKRGANLVTGGTDNHLVLIDVSGYGITGRQAESALLDAGIVTNRNAVPSDPNGAWYTSGVRIGTPALTSRGFGADEFDRVADLIVNVLKNTTPVTASTGQPGKAKYLLADGIADATKAASAELLDSQPAVSRTRTLTAESMAADDHHDDAADRLRRRPDHHDHPAVLRLLGAAGAPPRAEPSYDPEIEAAVQRDAAADRGLRTTPPADVLRHGLRDWTGTRTRAGEQLVDIRPLRPDHVQRACRDCGFQVGTRVLGRRGRSRHSPSRPWASAAWACRISMAAGTKMKRSQRSTARSISAYACSTRPTCTEPVSNEELVGARDRRAARHRDRGNEIRQREKCRRHVRGRQRQARLRSLNAARQACAVSGSRRSTSTTSIASIRTRRSRTPWAQWRNSCAKARSAASACPRRLPKPSVAPMRCIRSRRCRPSTHCGAGSRGRGAADGARTRHRVRSLLPARPGLPDGHHQSTDDSASRTSAAQSAVQPATPSTRT